MKALLVDDERLARVALRRLLKVYSDVEIVGEAANGNDALAQIDRLQPDVIFLDVEMPGCTGLELLNKLEEAPSVIFTTAYANYALAAFDASAIDYLVKPIASDRLESALEKARRVLTSKLPAKQYSQRVFLNDGERSWIVAVDEIKMFESEGNYTRIHFGGNRVMVCRSLNTLERKLDPNIFFRASRSHILNLEKVKSAQLQPDRTLLAVFSDGTQVTLSRRQSRRLREMFSL